MMLISRCIVILLLATIANTTLATMLDVAKPAPFVDCKDQYPDELIGTWRVDHDWTNRENARMQADQLASSNTTVASGQDDTSTVTITHDAYIYDLPTIGKIKRTYQVVGGSANRYTLELVDQNGATMVTSIEMVPCGLVMENIGACLDSFCMNFIEEILRTVYSNAGTTPDDDEMAKVVDQAIQSQAEQPQVRRTYFRRVANEEPES